MERLVNVYEAKTHLSRLLEQVANGEEIVLARSGKPVARLVPYQRTAQPRRLGLLAGRLTVTASFDDDEELADLFEGRTQPATEPTAGPDPR